MAAEGAGKRALITGLSGFTGHYVAQELRAAGYQIFGTITPGHTPGEGEFAVDLLDRAGLAAVIREVQPDVVAHLAAIAFVAHGDVEQIYRKRWRRPKRNRRQCCWRPAPISMAIPMSA
jgi:nucleoside-diphosphate-sugar epimerase